MLIRSLGFTDFLSSSFMFQNYLRRARNCYSNCFCWIVTRSNSLVRLYSSLWRQRSQTVAVKRASRYMNSFIEIQFYQLLQRIKTDFSVQAISYFNIIIKYTIFSRHQNFLSKIKFCCFENKFEMFRPQDLSFQQKIQGKRGSRGNTILSKNTLMTPTINHMTFNDDFINIQEDTLQVLEESIDNYRNTLHTYPSMEDLIHKPNLDFQQYYNLRSIKEQSLNKSSLQETRRTQAQRSKNEDNNIQTKIKKMQEMLADKFMSDIALTERAVNPKFKENPSAKIYNSSERKVDKKNIMGIQFRKRNQRDTVKVKKSEEKVSKKDRETPLIRQFSKKDFNFKSADRQSPQTSANLYQHSTQKKLKRSYKKKKIISREKENNNNDMRERGNTDSLQRDYKVTKQSQKTMRTKFLSGLQDRIDRIQNHLSEKDLKNLKQQIKLMKLIKKMETKVVKSIQNILTTAENNTKPTQRLLTFRPSRP